MTDRGVINLGPWLVLAMQLPSQPGYTRVKIWRRLREAGAVSLASGAHLLPDEQRHRDIFADALRDIVAGGGQATIVSGAIVDGSEDPEALFRSARTADFENWAGDAQSLLSSELKAASVTRMRRRLDAILTIEFVSTGWRNRAEEIMQSLLDASLRHPDVSRADPGHAYRVKELHGRTWVTRRGLGIDRIASAWLIRRFIDPRPHFRFVDPERYAHQQRELRFDMAEGEFTHEGDNCSFETLLSRSGIVADQGLIEIGRIIHQLDIDDGKYDCPGAPAFLEAIGTICGLHAEDDRRLAAGSDLLDDIYGNASSK